MPSFRLAACLILFSAAELALTAPSIAAGSESEGGPIDPDAGIVIDWANLDRIVASYNKTSEDEWLSPPSSDCKCNQLKYRALYCPWYIKPFRDAFDLVVTETKKWPVSRKLLACENDSGLLNGPQHTGLPMMDYFGVACCGIYANATQAFEGLSAFDTCWTEKDELQTCFRDGHLVPQMKTNLTLRQYRALIRNATYADAATPHLAGALRTESPQVISRRGEAPAGIAV
eukprot:TRINITY_DN21818_c0_g1_i1.p1 TRINITY_DN21818_c0_g1~~TRINITY_DN21818_c0_g1_i1.p1  ORF type:complete len:230 (+),score=24.18 TRINITY_DN21818_c0_g1_i1:74-763(+)